MKLGAGVGAAVGIGAVLNPVVGIAVGLYSVYAAHEDTQRIDAELEEFGYAANMFQITTEVLADSVDAIGTIIDNLEQISVSLHGIKDGADMMMNQLGEMQRRKLISDDDKRKLLRLIDFVIETTRNSKIKYETDRD